MSTNATPLPAKHAKRLRIFAGPNGSGKSTIAQSIAQNFRVGVSVQADELRSCLESGAGVTLPLVHPSLDGKDFAAFYKGHPLRTRCEGPFPFAMDPGGRLTLAEGCDRSPKLSYATVILADYLVTRLIEAGAEISLETALSHPSKLALLRLAKEAGYGIYLYYVCVASPEISKQRVALGATLGGYAVPEAKIVERYGRSLALLKEAVALSDRAYLFDNTYSGASLKLEVKRGSEVTPHEPVLPDWMTRSLPALIQR